MPGSTSAAKRHRLSLNRRKRNRIVRSSLRTKIRSFVKSLKQGDEEASKATFREFVKLADTASRKGVLPRNTVARKKSRMCHLLKSGQSSPH